MEDNEEEAPILGISINNETDLPFSDLYLDMFPEWYDVE
jgi:hypothetical protein